MTSILTNNASLVALQTLRATQNSLDTTQNQISTGLKVNTAKDNASTWAVATQMRSDVSTLSQVSTNLGSADNVVSVALAGATQISTLVSQIRSKLVAESDGSQDATKTAADINGLVSQINQIVQASSYNGVNLLDGSTTSMAFASSIVSGQNGGTSTLSFISIAPFSTASGSAKNLSATSSGGLSGLTSYTSSAGLSDTTTLTNAIHTLDSLASFVNTVAANLGSLQSNIESQKTFVSNLADTLTSGVGNLVDADMTAESARLSALQTQQSLGTQALSIANSAPQSILRLFQ